MPGQGSGSHMLEMKIKDPGALRLGVAKEINIFIKKIFSTMTQDAKKSKNYFRGIQPPGVCCPFLPISYFVCTAIPKVTKLNFSPVDFTLEY